MAGSFISTWMLSLLLLPFFMPSSVRCSPFIKVCGNTWVNEFFSNLKSLETIIKECPGNVNLEISSNSTNNRCPSETCEFPCSFFHGVKSLFKNQCFNASKNQQVKDHLPERLHYAQNCPELVEMYCSNRAKSDPIVSPNDLHSKLETLMTKYKNSLP